MNPSLASVLCILGVAGLFYLDRDKTVRTAKALWLPVIWLAVSASRPVSMWFGTTPTGQSAQLEGSPLDAAFYGCLLAIALAVLFHRGRSTRILLRANWPILLYFAYCLISVLWSVHHGVAFKRWIKAIGDPAMAFVVVTDRLSIVAFQRLVSRVGFLLLPASVLLIKYYPILGRGYAPDGMQMNTGVSTDKNILGVTVLVISLGTLWHVLTLLRDKERPNRRRHLIAQVSLLLFGLTLFKMADSATSLACFILGSGIILATRTRMIRKRPSLVHLLCFAIILFGAVLMLAGGEGSVVHVLGRKSNLSGRTDIWAAVIPAAPNALVGAGFESFWISPSVLQFQHTLRVGGWWHPENLNEAHNGYIELYLNLGCAGVVLIAFVLMSGYRRAVQAYRRNFSIGGLMLAYIVAAVVYSITEAGFRMMDPMWVFLLLAIVSCTGVVTGVFNAEIPGNPTRRNVAPNRSAAELSPAHSVAFPVPQEEEAVSLRRRIF